MRFPIGWVRALLPAAALAAAMSGVGRADSVDVRFAGETRTDRLETAEIEGVTYFRVGDIARLVGAARHWDPRTKKLALTIDGRTVTTTVGNPFVTVDDVVWNVHRPVRLFRDAVWVPPGFLGEVLIQGANTEIIYSPADQTVMVTRLGPVIVSAVISELEEGTLLTVGLSGLAEFATRSIEKDAIEVTVPGSRLAPGLSVGTGVGLVDSLTAEETPDGVRFVLHVAGAAASYGAESYRDPRRIELLVKAAPRSGFPEPQLKEPKRVLSPGNDVLARDDGLDTVMIDPGHGGNDAGAGGPTGLLEKELALDISKMMSRQLQEQGFYVFMTRASDAFVSFKRRPEMANLAMADVFLSIHLNASYSDSPGGFEVYFNGSRSGAPDGVAERAGEPLRYDGRDRARSGGELFTWGRVHERFADESRRLAESINREMRAALPLRSGGVKSGDFVVLKGCYMPAVLLEVAYVTNPADRGLLDDRGFREQLAKSVARGVARYRDSARERKP